MVPTQLHDSNAVWLMNRDPYAFSSALDCEYIDDHLKQLQMDSPFHIIPENQIKDGIYSHNASRDHQARRVIDAILHNSNTRRRWSGVVVPRLISSALDNGIDDLVGKQYVYKVTETVRQAIMPTQEFVEYIAQTRQTL